MNFNKHNIAKPRQPLSQPQRR